MMPIALAMTELDAGAAPITIRGRSSFPESICRSNRKSGETFLYLLQKRLESLMVTTMLNLNTPEWRSEPTITIFRMKSTGLASNLNLKIQMTRSSLALKMIWMTTIMMTSSMITTKILILQYSMILL